MPIWAQFHITPVWDSLWKDASKRVNEELLWKDSPLLPKQKILSYLERTSFRTKDIHPVKQHSLAQALPLEMIKSVSCLRKKLLQKGPNNYLGSFFRHWHLIDTPQVPLTNPLLQRWKSLQHIILVRVLPIAAF